MAGGEAKFLGWQWRRVCAWECGVEAGRMPLRSLAHSAGRWGAGQAGGAGLGEFAGSLALVPGEPCREAARAQCNFFASARSAPRLCAAAQLSFLTVSERRKQLACHWYCCMVPPAYL